MHRHAIRGLARLSIVFAVTQVSALRADDSLAKEAVPKGEMTKYSSDNKG